MVHRHQSNTLTLILVVLHRIKLNLEAIDHHLMKRQNCNNILILIVEANDDFNILARWKSHKVKYLVLSTMAGDIQTFPMPIEAMEYAFSICQCVLNEYSSILESRIGEALICFIFFLGKKEMKIIRFFHLLKVDFINVILFLCYMHHVLV